MLLLFKNDLNNENSFYCFGSIIFVLLQKFILVLLFHIKHDYLSFSRIYYFNEKYNYIIINNNYIYIICLSEKKKLIYLK